tara:strand:- start:3953 stop:10819 length:6867 start_codon:yes stop_codon:yes gene_type:complete
MSATIYDYLDSKRRENPVYQGYSNLQLYRELKGIDSSLPVWEAVDNSVQPPQKKSPLNKKQDPGFINSLYNWTDWGIDETDPNWVKNAYNTSITGLSYSAYNQGKSKYTIDENWNPGILEDIGSGVLSFMMPMDIASMWVGGWVGKAGLAASSATNAVQRKAVKNLMAKGISKEGAENTVKNILSGKSADLIQKGVIGKYLAKSQIAQSAAPRLAGAGLQGATLATFEGVRGGLEAWNNGEDTKGIFEGIGGGIAHGGIMGGLAGFAGASLNIKHAKLFAKADEPGLSTTQRISAAVKGDMQQAGLLATGAVGQVGVEAGVFTAPDIYKTITDDNFQTEDLLRSLAVNVGMMGLLKVKHKTLEKGFNEANKIAAEYRARAEKDKNVFESIQEGIKESMDSAKEKAESSAESKSLEAASNTLTKDYLNPELKKFNITLEELKGFEGRTKETLNMIDKYGAGIIGPDAISGKKYASMYGSILETKSILESNINRHKKNVEGKQGVIDRLKKTIDEFDTIQDYLNDYKNAKKAPEPAPAEVANLKVRFGNEIKKAFEEGNKTTIDILTEGNKEFVKIDKEGNVKFEPEFKMGVAKEQLKGVEGTTDRLKKELTDKDAPADVVDKITQTKEQLPYDPATPKFQERINELEATIKRTKDIAKKEPFQEELKLLNASKEIRDRQLPEAQGGESYRQSKPFLDYISQKVLPGWKSRTTGVVMKDKAGYLKQYDKLVQWLAKNRNKNIFELTDRDVIAYFKTGKSTSHANQWAFIIQRLKEGGMSAAKVGQLNLSTAGTIKGRITKIDEALIGKSGPRTVQREGMESYWKYGKNFIEFIQPKKGGLTGLVKKYVTPKLGKVLNKFSKDTNAPEGHSDFLFRDVNGKAINDATLKALVVKYMGKKNIPKGRAGEHRAFRYSFQQYAEKKYGRGKKTQEVLELILGDTPTKTLEDRYGATVYNKLESQASKWVNEYLADIKQGYFHEGGIKDNPRVEIDRKLAKDEAGYNPFEIKEGLKKLDKAKKITANGVEVSKETAEAMFQYMIQTAPRINEIAPKQSEINARIKAVEAERADLAKAEIKESEKIQRQLKSAEQVISEEQLANQIKWQKEKHPDLSVKVEKDLGKFRGQYVLGKITGKLIEIAEGRAKKDTLPHEVSHDVVNVLKASGDKFSKKLVDRGIKMFGTEEKLVDALGQYTSNRLKNKTMTSKMKSWVSSVISYFRQYFGINNPNDVSRIKSDIVNILGEKVFKGKKPSDYMGSAASLKVQYSLADTKAGYKNLKKANDAVNVTKRELKKNYNISEEAIRKITKDELGVERWTIKEGKENSVNVNQLWNLQTKLNNLAVARGSGKSIKKSTNESYVEKAEQQYNINENQRNSFFKETYNTSFENATEAQIKHYRSIISQGKETPALLTPSIDYVVNAKDVAGSIAVWKRPFMTVGDVLRKYGGAYRKISEALDQHDHVRTIYYGEAQVHLNRIAAIVDSKTRNNYMHLIDKDLAAGAIKSLKELTNKYPNNKKYANELKEAESISKKFRDKDGDFKSAADIWKKLSDGFWDALTVEVNKNANPQEAKAIVSELGKKYINNYFTRRLKPETMKYLDANTPAVIKLAKDTIGKMSKKELKEAADKLVSTKKIKRSSSDYKAIVEGKGAETKHLIDIVANEIFDIYKFNPVKVKPSFLKERGIQLPEYIELMTEKGKRIVKTYETSMDATMTNYALGMSRFLATVRLFPEFTELGGKFSIDRGRKAQAMEMMKKNEMGAYALEAINRQLGITHNAQDILNNKFLMGAGRVTNMSAAIGLSSPTSGIKNFLIQMPRNVAIFGARNTAKALARGLNIYNDPKLYEQAIREGQIGFGTKVIFEESPTVGKKIKWWFDNVNLMMKSENLNRIVSAEAAKMHFNELTNKLRGKPSLFHPKAKTPEVERYLKYNYRLTDKQIDFIIKEPNLTGNKEFNKIQEWVGFQGHKRAAGATGVSDLPLWMSNKYAKPFTLFQRIALSVTNDSYYNYVKPMRNGNFAPILKATIGHGLAGAALYGMYDSLIGQQPPKEDSPAIDRAISYIWRGEALGLYGEIINPNQKELSMPIMEPVIIRNAMLAWDNITEALAYKKSWPDAIKDIGLKTVVIVGQAEKILLNAKHPYVEKYKRIKTLERTFENDNDYGADGEFEKNKRSPYYWKLKKSIMLGKTDDEIAKAYYAAYNYLIHDAEVRLKIKSKKKRIAYAKSAIRQSVNKMSPVNQSKEKNGRPISRYKEFMNFLSPSNRKMAEDAMKTYEFKVRAFNRIIKNATYRQRYSIY